MYTNQKNSLFDAAARVMGHSLLLFAMWLRVLWVTVFFSSRGEQVFLIPGYFGVHGFDLLCFWQSVYHSRGGQTTSHMCRNTYKHKEKRPHRSMVVISCFRRQHDAVAISFD